MKPCKHENADHLAPDYDSRDLSGWARVEQLRCIDCGAWLSLGASNDRPLRVRIEIATAGLIAGYITGNDTDVTLDDPIAKEVLDYQLGETPPLSKAAVQCDVLYGVMARHFDREIAAQGDVS